jgi:hypothetical protein
LVGPVGWAVRDCNLCTRDTFGEGGSVSKDKDDLPAWFVITCFGCAFLAVIGSCGGLGGLIGYGSTGTLQGACLGAGVALAILLFLSIAG